MIAELPPRDWGGKAPVGATLKKHAQTSCLSGGVPITSQSAPAARMNAMEFSPSRRETMPARCTAIAGLIGMLMTACVWLPGCTSTLEELVEQRHQASNRGSQRQSARGPRRDGWHRVLHR